MNRCREKIAGMAPMKRLASIAIGCFILLGSASGFAQQTPNPSTSEPPYGYYHMWGSGPWGWPAGMMFAPIMMLLIVVGIVALIVLLMRGVGYGSHWYRHGDWPPYGRWQGRGALDILEERFAKGEIDKAEFEEKRSLLRR
jgi:putative membrane protein